MSLIFVSPAEPPALKVLGESAAITESYGADFLIPGNGFWVAVQRKLFPGDFLSSLYDGRLSTSLIEMTKADVRILLLEGKPAWTTSGFLLDDHRQFSRTQLRNLCHSAHYELGVETVWTDSITDTIDAVRDLARWAEKPQHSSLFNRPTDKDLNKRRWTQRDEAIFLLQGFNGIGPELAGRIFDELGRVPLRWDVDNEALLAIKGIGKERLAKLKELVK